MTSRTLLTYLQQGGNCSKRVMPLSIRGSVTQGLSITKITMSQLQGRQRRDLAQGSMLNGLLTVQSAPFTMMSTLKTRFTHQHYPNVLHHLQLKTLETQRNPTQEAQHPRPRPRNRYAGISGRRSSSVSLDCEMRRRYESITIHPNSLTTIAELTEDEFSTAPFKKRFFAQEPLLDGIWTKYKIQRMLGNLASSLVEVQGDQEASPR